MKKTWLLLLCLTVFACKKNKDDDTSGKRIFVTGANINYNYKLEYSGDKLVSAVTSNDLPDYKFTYDNSGLLTKVEVSGTSSPATYEVIYLGAQPVRTNKKVNGALDAYYTYSYAGNVISTISVYNPVTNNVIATYNGQYQGNYLTTITSPGAKNYFYKTQLAPTALSMWLFPDFPVVLMQIPQLEKESSGGSEISYRYQL